MTERPRHIVLAYAWGNRNAGDRAITSGTLALLREALDDVRVTVLSIFNDSDDEFECTRTYLDRHADARVVPTPYPGRVRWLPALLAAPLRVTCAALSVICPRVYGRWQYGNAGYAALIDADFVLYNTGHMFFWSATLGERRLLLSKVYPLLRAARCGIPYGLYGQTLGPFEFKRYSAARWFFRRLLRGSRFVCTRESISQRVLAANFPDTTCAGTVLDSAFFCTETDDQGALELLADAGLANRAFIAITVRLTRRGGRASIAPDARQRYVTRLARVFEALIDTTALPLLFVCQVPGDADDARAVVTEMDTRTHAACFHAAHSTSAGLLRSLYGRAAAVVGMRFHALVFAASMGTPVYGIYFDDISHKTAGLLSDFGMNEYHSHVEEIDPAECATRVQQLVTDRDDISRRIMDHQAVLRRRSIAVLRQGIAARGTDPPAAHSTIAQ